MSCRSLRAILQAWCAASLLLATTLVHAQAGIDLGLSPRPETPPPAVATLETAQASSDAATLLESTAKTTSSAIPMFGTQLFNTKSERNYGTGSNPDYSLSIGDRVTLRMWGSFNYEAVQIIDPQGNVFLPNVGPVKLAGVPNRDLNEVVRAAVQRVYRNNVNVYASLEVSQPVRVFVTGFVRAPGQYAGTAGEPVLGYLSRAGGIDPERGSYIDLRVMRGGAERAKINLYDFLLEGQLPAMQLADGDTLVVGPRHNAVTVSGEVFNPFGFEFRESQATAADIIALARVKPGATHVSIIHRSGTKQTGEYHPIGELGAVRLSPGDELAVVADRSAASILVRVDGAVASSRVLTLPYGSKLKDAMARIETTAQAQPDALQLFRASVARRQKEMLEMSLRALETNALTSRSATREESALRTEEAALIQRFVQRARMVEPRGQVVLGPQAAAMNMLLEDGDVLVVPEKSSIVMVHGEVTQPQAVAYDPRSSVRDYLEVAGGTTQKANDSRVLLVHQNGGFEQVEQLGRWHFGGGADLAPGDEIVVLPKIGSRRVEVTRGITQILYQIAIAAKVILDF